MPRPRARTSTRNRAPAHPSSHTAKESGNARDARPARTVPPGVVVVGGSAGGLESLKAMLRNLPASFPAPILAVLHLDPKRPSNAAALLAGHTILPVHQAVAGERLHPGIVYLGHPDRHLEVRQGRLALTRGARVNFSRPSVDRLLTSAAKAYGKGTMAIILSGTGYDGREGVQRVKAAGGTCIVEDPNTASQSGMPQAAAATGCADAVLPADRLGAYLVHSTSGPRVRVTASAWRSAAALLKRECGVDFKGYHPETLRRRMESRIAATGSRSAKEYVASLRGDDAELEHLRSALLVKVSAFVRDPAFWSILEKRCLASLARRDGGREIRMWSAGCATGEEAYTLAMLTLAAGRRPLALKVFATDIDEPALEKARAGRYAGDAVKGMPRSLVRRFFKSDGNGKRVGPEARRHVIFGRHDLLNDPPLTGIDVVACRNVLIYLKPAERQEVLDRLTNALRPGGFLFLGKAEGAPIPGPDFVRIAPGAPIFRRLGSTLRGISAVPPSKLAGPRLRPTATPPVAGRPHAEPVLFAIDPDLHMTLWNHAAAECFGRPSEEVIGLPLATVFAGVKPGFVNAIRKALGGRKRSRLPRLTLDSGGLTLEAIPLPGKAGLMLVGQVEAATNRKQSKAGLRLPADSADQNPAAFMEAQQSLNEELQSRNEELETVNEELQSLNDEIQVQSDEVRRATLFLSAMLDSGPDVFVGCDRQGNVSYWGTPAVGQFGLSAAQALGKDLLKLVPRLDVAPLRRLLRKGEGWSTKSRKPRTVTVPGGLRVSVFPALDDDGKRHGTLLRLLDVQERK